MPAGAANAPASYGQSSRGAAQAKVAPPSAGSARGGVGGDPDGVPRRWRRDRDPTMVYEC